MRFRLRTLLVMLAVLPPLLAAGWIAYSEWRADQARRESRVRAVPDGGTVFLAGRAINVPSATQNDPRN